MALTLLQLHMAFQVQVEQEVTEETEGPSQDPILIVVGAQDGYLQEQALQQEEKMRRAGQVEILSAAVAVAAVAASAASVAAVAAVTITVVVAVLAHPRAGGGGVDHHLCRRRAGRADRAGVRPGRDVAGLAVRAIHRVRHHRPDQCDEHD